MLRCIHTHKSINVSSHIAFNLLSVKRRFSRSSREESKGGSLQSLGFDTADSSGIIEDNTTAFGKIALIPSNSSLSRFICRFAERCLEGLVAGVSSVTLLGR